MCLCVCVCCVGLCEFVWVCVFSVCLFCVFVYILCAGVRLCVCVSCVLCHCMFWVFVDLWVRLLVGFGGIWEDLEAFESM